MLLVPMMSFGQAPESFNYQAVVRDAGGIILNNQPVGMRLTVQQGSIGGTAVYTETFTSTTNDYGLVNLEIGTGTSTDDFSTIDWANGPYFMETAVDVSGGTNYSVMGTSQLMSVPYALYAKTSGNGEGPQGDQGPTGPQGPQGVQGPTGQNGNGIVSSTDNGDGTFTLTYTDGSSFTTSNLTGPQGIQGLQGATGQQGIQGNAGAQGLTGANGNGIASTIDNGDGTFTLIYTDGSSFTTSNLTGPQGIQGLQGATGQQGIQGNAGAQGLTGANGNGIASTIDNGDGTFTLIYTDGSSFTTSNLTGPQGIQGLQGATGQQGIQGNAGAQGTAGADGLDAVVDYDSLANIISVDSSFTANISGSIGGGCDLKYPDGLDGEFITIELSDVNQNTSPYTVPQGKTFYILSAYSLGQIYITDESNTPVVAFQAIQTAGYSEGKKSLINPIILFEGQTISGSGNNNTSCAINGILINTGITPLSKNNQYQVPNGKLFVITNILGTGSTFFFIDGVKMATNASTYLIGQPIIVNGGQVVDIGNYGIINGYLVDEDYFANCGGGSSGSGGNTATESFYYPDADGDGYGGDNNWVWAVNAPPGYISDNTDCDDTASSINPDGTEIFDSIDNNCDGLVDEGFFAIGDTLQEGIVFYVDSSGEHGLLAANEVYTGGWGCFGTQVNGADGTAIGTGNQNTIDIESTGCSNSSVTAAGICGNLTLDGYSDWFLPSKDELNLISQLFISSPGIFQSPNPVYWSSSEINMSNAWAIELSSGNWYNYFNKPNTYSVLPIRAF